MAFAAEIPPVTFVQVFIVRGLHGLSPEGAVLHLVLAATVARRAKRAPELLLTAGIRVGLTSRP